MGILGVEMRGWSRRNAESIAGLTDCSMAGIRQVPVVGMAKGLGIEAEELVVQSREGIMCALSMELMSGIELKGGEAAYDERRILKVCCLCAFSGSSRKKEMAKKLAGSCQLTSCSRSVVMREESSSSRSRSRIAFV